jgi:hypothetical protein
MSSMSRRDDYQARMQERLELWAARFEALKNKARAAPRGEHRAELQELTAKAQTAANTLSLLKASRDGEEWDVLAGEMEKVWNRMELALDAPDETLPSGRMADSAPVRLAGLLQATEAERGST